MGGTQVTEAGVEEFRNRRPSVVVTWWKSRDEVERYVNVAP